MTGASRSTMEDFRGGLLADDMGLGKTLMLIASMVATREHAMHHSIQRQLETHGSKSESSLIPVKSTLVLVPSACKLDALFKNAATCLSSASID